MMNALLNSFPMDPDTPQASGLLGQFREMLLESSGIRIAEHKESLVRHRLAKRVSATGCEGLNTYLRNVLHNEDWWHERQVAIDMMTTNTTYFFREATHYDFLAGAIIPDLAATAGRGYPFKVNIWSAAASEGAEAYTAAMVMAELKTLHPCMEYAILGTDLSPRMVEIANAGIYRATQAEKIPDYLRKKYLLKGRNEDEGRVRFDKLIRSRTRFVQMNLMDATYPVPPEVDVAFLRNVLIYFGAEDQQAVVSRVIARIKPGGFLLVGHAESMIVEHPDVIQIRPSIFRKYGNAPYDS